MKPGAAAATLPDESDKVRDEFSPLPPPQSSSPLTLLSALRLRRHRPGFLYPRSSSRRPLSAVPDWSQTNFPAAEHLSRPLSRITRAKTGIIKALQIKKEEIKEAELSLLVLGSKEALKD